MDNITNNSNWTKVSENVIKTSGVYWHNYKREPYVKTRITGKYLFFSAESSVLEKIALDELEDGGFQQAKIIREEFKKGKDFVLCLYYSNDSRDAELAGKYKDYPGVTFGNWKSNEQTYKEFFKKRPIY